MPLVMPVDYDKFSQSHPFYKGSGISKLKIKNNNNKHPFYHSSFARSKSGGLLNYNDIISGASKVINAIQDNKDLIQSGMSTISAVADATKAVSDTVKSSKDAEAINIRNKKAKKSKDNSDNDKFTPEQEAKMRNLGFIGNGFAKI